MPFQMWKFDSISNSTCSHPVFDHIMNRSCLAEFQRLGPKMAEVDPVKAVTNEVESIKTGVMKLIQNKKKIPQVFERLGKIKESNQDYKCR